MQAHDIKHAAAALQRAAQGGMLDALPHFIGAVQVGILTVDEVRVALGLPPRLMVQPTVPMAA